MDLVLRVRDGQRGREMYLTGVEDGKMKSQLISRSNTVNFTVKSVCMRYVSVGFFRSPCAV